MKNITKLRVLLTLTILFVFTPSGYGQTGVFDINLSGTVPSSGAELQVFGVLNVDPSMPFTASNATGELFFQIDNNSPIALPQTGTGFLGNNANDTSLRWNVVGDELFLGFNASTSPQDQTFSFDAVSNQGSDVSLFFNGAFSSDPNFSFSFVQVQLQSEFGAVQFSSSTEPGIRLGTLSTVPEPSGVTLFAVGSLFFLLRRKKQHLST